MSTPLMRLINADGEVVEQADRTAELEAQVQDLEGEVAKLKDALLYQSTKNGQLNSQLAALKQKRNTTSRKLDPFAADAERVFDYWKNMIAPGAREFGEKRYAPVRARLNAGYTVDELCRAVAGASVLPADLRARDAMQELEYVVRHETHVRKFCKDAQRHSERILDAMIKPLALTYGKSCHRDSDVVTGDVYAWWAPCPLCHPDRGPLGEVADLRLRPSIPGLGGWVELACKQGCEQSAIRDRLREMVTAR